MVVYGLVLWYDKVSISGDIIYQMINGSHDAVQKHWVWVIYFYNSILITRECEWAFASAKRWIV